MRPASLRGYVVALLLAPAIASAGPLEVNHPKVQAGNEAYRRGDFQGALRAYESALGDLPDSPELHYNLGDAQLKLGHPEEARRAYEVALRRRPGSLQAGTYYNLGNALVTLDQKDDAITAYRQALKLDPGFEPARHNLEVLLRERKHKPGSPDGGTLADGGGEADGGTDGGPKDAGQSREAPDGGVLTDAGGQEDGGSRRTDAGRLDGGSRPADAGSSDGGGSGKSDGGDGGPGGPGPRRPPRPRDPGPVDFQPRTKQPVEKDW